MTRARNVGLDEQSLHLNVTFSRGISALRILHLPGATLRLIRRAQLETFVIDEA